MAWVGIAMAAISAVQGMQQAKAQKKAAAANAAAEAQSAQYAIDEATRAQHSANRVADEKTSDRIMQLNADLGRARVASAEGFGGFHRDVISLGHIAGLDMSRIETNRLEMIESLQAKKTAAAQGAANAMSASERVASAASKAAILNTVGAGVSILGAQSRYNTLQNLSMNRNPGLVTGGTT